jgi:hypothetical protein
MRIPGNGLENRVNSGFAGNRRMARGTARADSGVRVACPHQNISSKVPADFAPKRPEATIPRKAQQ